MFRCTPILEEVVVGQPPTDNVAGVPYSANQRLQTCAGRNYRYALGYFAKGIFLQCNMR